MRPYAPACAALALLACALPGGGGKKAATEGDWEVVSVVLDGEKRPAPKEKQVLTLKGGKYAIRQGDKVVREGAYKEDPKAEPTAVDITPGDGPNKGKEIPAIYEVEGDTYRVCVAPIGQARPKAFESVKDSGLMLTTYKRVKK